jgi:hypothetical protein
MAIIEIAVVAPIAIIDRPVIAIIPAVIGIRPGPIDADPHAAGTGRQGNAGQRQQGKRYSTFHDTISNGTNPFIPIKRMKSGIVSWELAFPS